MATEASRAELYSLLRRSLGDDTAAALMQALPPMDWGDIARRSDVESVDADLRKLEGRFDRLEVRFDRLEAQFSEQRADIAKLRNESLDVKDMVIGLHGKIDAQVPRYLRANVMTAFVAAGFVLTAVKL